MSDKTVVYIRRGAIFGGDSTVITTGDPRSPFISDEMAAQDAEVLARWLRGAIPAKTLKCTLDKIQELRDRAHGQWETTGEFEQPFFKWFKELPASLKYIPKEPELDNPYDRED